MASSAPAKKLKCEWLVILPDYDGALPKRMEVRPSHLEAVKEHAESGFWLWGGATLGEQPEEGKPLDIKGSTMLAFADTKEEVLDMIKKDIYATSKVWDLSKVQIFPFKSAIRSAM